MVPAEHAHDAEMGQPDGCRRPVSAMVLDPGTALHHRDPYGVRRIARKIQVDRLGHAVDTAGAIAGEMSSVSPVPCMCFLPRADHGVVVLGGAVQVLAGLGRQLRVRRGW
jgi:hypothetical protein